METLSEADSRVEIKQEPIDDLVVVIKTEPKWESEESSGRLTENVNAASLDTLQGEIEVYPSVKLEPVENSTEESEGGENDVHSDPVDTYCTGIKREATEQIVKIVKEEPSACTDCSRLSQDLGEDNDTKKGVLVGLVPFLKQELDCNLHSFRKERSLSEGADGLSESVPRFDEGEDSAGDSPESPRLVIADAEDSTTGPAGSEHSVESSLLGDGWRITVFRCGHCMALAWDVFWMARHNCVLPQQRELSSRILNRLRRGTQVKYINTFGCHVCGKLFFKRKCYRKHVFTMHTEAMLQPFVQSKVSSEGDCCEQSVSETPESSVVQLRKDRRVVNSNETNPNLSQDSDETVAEDSVGSSLKLARVENSDSSNVCVVCGKDLCQMHKYTLIRAKCEATEKVTTFTCHRCERDFRCEENYWRHMYYHGFKTENLLEEEQTAVSQADGRVGSKKKTRRPRKKSTAEADPSAATCSVNGLSQSAVLSVADGCSSKSGHQREGTGVIGRAGDVCFASADECEIHNSALTSDGNASKNNKRKTSAVSLITEEGEPDPKKKRCTPPEDEHSSPSDDCVTVEMAAPPGCSSPQHPPEAFQPESSLAKDTWGPVTIPDGREWECATGREISNVSLAGACSEGLNECSVEEVVNEDGVGISTDKPSEGYNSFSNSVSDTFSAGASTGKIHVPSLQQRKGMGQTAVEVIDIDDHDGGHDNGKLEVSSALPVPESSSFEMEAKCDGETVTVSEQENEEQSLNSSSCISERGHCQPGKTCRTFQNMEVDFSCKDREASSVGGGTAGERSPSAVCGVTVGVSQMPGASFVRAGVNFGTRVAVVKCVNGDSGVSRLSCEKPAPTTCEGRANVRVLQVSNTAVYQTVPVRQLTKLRLVPTESYLENSGETAGSLRKPSRLVLKVIGTPQTRMCLLRCEKCNLLGKYGPTFFSHKCVSPNSRVNDVSKVHSADSSKVMPNDGSKQLSADGSKVVPNDNLGSTSESSRGASAEAGSTGSVLWKCLRCKFTTPHSDVFKSHSCESTPHQNSGGVESDGRTASVETRRDTSVTSGVPSKYLWKCTGCSLYSNSKQCLLMHKCSSFKKKSTGPDAAFTSCPELMCCKCGFKTAGRLMFATHHCSSYEPPPLVPLGKVPMKRSAHGAPDGSPAKVCQKSPQKSGLGDVHESVLNFLLMHSGAKMVENNGSFLVMLPNV